MNCLIADLSFVEKWRNDAIGGCVVIQQVMGTVPVLESVTTLIYPSLWACESF